MYTTMSTEKVHLSLRVPRNTFAEFEQYRDASGDGEISKSDAARQLLESGLEAERGEPNQYSQTDGFLTTLGAVLAASTVGAGAAYLFLPAVESTGFVLFVAIATVAVNALTFAARELRVI